MNILTWRRVLYISIGAALGLGWSYYSIVHESLEDRLQYTARIASRLQGSMPDPYTRFEAATAGPGRRLTYRFTLLHQPDEDSPAGHVEEFAREIRSRVCVIEKIRGYLSEGVVVTYQYSDREGSKEVRIDIRDRDCTNGSI